VAELRRLREPVMVVATHNLDPIELPVMDIVATQHFGGAAPVIIDDRPTPPEAPRAKKGKK
jgi:hypothetical protein